MDLEQKIGEVIETSNSEFLTQCYKLDDAPSLGSMVKTRAKEYTIYGVVYYSATHSIEPGRRIIARGRSAETEEEVYKANPQLERLLCTDFRALVIGYAHESAVRQHLPPFPASIYAFVYNANHEEVKRLTQSLNFLNLLLEGRLPVMTDDVIAAFLRCASQAYESPRDFLIKAGKELAWLLSDDIRRLDSILKRIN
jgi:hypothetical protein